MVVWRVWAWLAGAGCGREEGGGWCGTPTSLARRISEVPTHKGVGKKRTLGGRPRLGASWPQVAPHLLARTPATGHRLLSARKVCEDSSRPVGILHRAVCPRRASSNWRAT